MEKLRSLYWLGVIAGGVNLALSLYAITKEGMPTGLLVPFIFGSIGLVVAWFGASRHDIVIWAGGLLASTLLAPTTFGFIPLLTAVFFVIFAVVVFLKARR